MSFLVLLLDMSKEHTFEVSPPYFSSTRLHPPRPPPLGKGKGTRRGPVGLATSSTLFSQSSLGFGGDSLAAGFDHRDANGNTLVEDPRETYSTQAALLEPLPTEESDAEGPNSSQELSSPSQGGSMLPVFAAGAKTLGFSGGKPRETSKHEQGEEAGEGEAIVLEMSHVNREPCMRSLLLVMESERKMFEKGWQESVEETKGG